MLISLVFASVLAATSLAVCPEGYVFYKGDNTCLKAFSTMKNFYDARRTCQSDGGDLAQVHDAAKATFIGGIHSHLYWMGVWDWDKDRQFSYIDGTPVGSYHPWRRGEPNNSGGREYCVLVDGRTQTDKGQWIDGNCKTKLPFVCEM